MTTEQDQNLPLAAPASVESAKDKFKGVPTLRRRLLTWLLPAAVLPLIVGTAIEYNISKNRTEEAAFAKLRYDSLLASEEVEIFIEESFLKLHTLIENNPLVLEAMQSGTELAQSQNLPQQPIEAVEQKFAATKLLQNNPSLNNYLQRIVKNTGSVAEIIVTERNGFNIAYSSPTSDFVQRDESWWQGAQQEGTFAENAEFDQSAKAQVFPLSKAVRDPNTGEFLGVIKIGVLSAESDRNLATYLSGGLGETEAVQLVNVDTNEVTTTITNEGANPEVREVIGGKNILMVANVLSNAAEDSQSLEEVRQEIAKYPGFEIISLEQQEINSEPYISIELKYEDKIYAVTTVADVSYVTIASIDFAEILAEERSLLLIFILTTIVIDGLAVAAIILIARQIAKPITNLSAVTQQAATGNLDVQADVEGSLETQTLADNFNNLVKKTKESLQQQKDLTEAQRQGKEHLELAIYTLIDEIGDATDGDLTVRANLDSLELSTVADLFNAIIDNLQEIAIEAKQSSSQVGSSLQQNEQKIRKLAEQAIAEAEETRNTLMSVEQMAQSIKTVATNANQAEKIADDTYNTVLNSSNDMDSTVDSILNLRTTVSDTANKMQRLAESSQKISQAVSLIEEIALKTNVLAINAGAEADRAGEYGQGFSVVAEQVGALAEQSKTAIKEIAGVVSRIQAETQDVKQAMESGTAQVLNTTRLVENTKQSLAEVLEKSQTINQLMESISQSTVSQADTSQNVTSLMQKIAQLSAITSKSSTEVAQSIGETARVAEKLESAVSQFKVAK